MIFLNKVPSVFIVVSLVLLANAQKQSNNLRDVDFHELARQNVITKQILEAFIQKKLGLASTNVRAPSIFDILPVKKIEDRPIRQSNNRNLKNIPSEIIEDIPEDEEIPEESEISDDSELPEDLPENSDHNSERIPENIELPDISVQDYGEDDNLQSVESEQVDSIYAEGRSKKYTSQFVEGELEPFNRKQIILKPPSIGNVYDDFIYHIFSVNKLIDALFFFSLTSCSPSSSYL